MEKKELKKLKDSIFFGDKGKDNGIFGLMRKWQLYNNEQGKGFWKDVSKLQRKHLPKLTTPSVRGEEFTERETKNFLWGLERGFKDGYTEAYLELGKEYDARFREQKSMEYMKVKNAELSPQTTEGESK